MALSFLCVSTFFKGNEFLKSCKEAGNTVYLLTAKKLEHKPWVREYVDEFFYVEEELEGSYDMQKLITGLAYMIRSRKWAAFSTSKSSKATMRSILRLRIM